MARQIYPAQSWTQGHQNYQSDLMQLPYIHVPLFEHVDVLISSPHSIMVGNSKWIN